MQEIIILKKKTQKGNKSSGRRGDVHQNELPQSYLMQNMEVIKMDYLNDADSMYVDSKVTWF